jgi:hypothetical protein
MTIYLRSVKVPLHETSNECKLETPLAVVGMT